MKLFHRKKNIEPEDARAVPEELEGLDAGDGEPEGASVEPSTAQGEEVAPDAPEPEDAADKPEDAAGVDKEDGSPDDFFDLPPEKLADYMPRGQVVAAPRQLNFRPVLKVLGFLAGLVIVIAGIYFIWPTSVARVPDLVGKTLTEAMDAARAKGFSPVVKTWRWSESHSDGVVLLQNPVSARVVKKGAEISLTVSKGPRPEQGTKKKPATTVPQAPPAGGPYAGKVICVDPGGQSRPDIDEWADPGMTRKNSPEPEIRGVTTGNAEYLVNMDIALKLKNLLEKDGMTVVMTRESNDVEISNAMRAEMANNANANLYMRIHCANSDDPFKRGTQTLYPTESVWSEAIFQQSKAAALFVQAEVIRSCGTEDLGTIPTHDLAGFNWSRVPVVQAEPGYLSSPRDDTLLAEDNYRWKVAWGLRNGIIKYLTNP
ncbi:MAG: N-acetylmuramoyl-L-alanine amidase [Candidatus Geothermincolia bacterium]